MTAVMSEKVNGYTVEVTYDMDPESPREWDNACRLVMSHNRYRFPNEADVDFDAYDGWDEVEKALRSKHRAHLIVPVYMYDHSGLAFRAGRGFGDVDSGRWDWGQVGFAYLTKSDLRREWGKDQEREQKALASIEAELDAYESFVNGNVYCFSVEDEDGNLIESCAGFYDMDDALKEGKSIAENNEYGAPRAQRTEEAKALDDTELTSALRENAQTIISEDEGDELTKALAAMPALAAEKLRRIG